MPGQKANKGKHREWFRFEMFFRSGTVWDVSIVDLSIMKALRLNDRHSHTAH